MRCALFNLAHCSRSPCSDRPCARLLGVFPSESEARAHASEHLADCGVDLHLADLRSWFVVMREHGGDERRHLEKLREAARRRAKTHEEEFWENRTLRRTGAVPEPEPRVAPLCRREQSGVATAPLRRAAELRLQRFAVVSLLPDHDEPDVERQQPGLVVWGAYDSEAEARAAIKDDLAHVVSDVHLDVVHMYEWLVLNEVPLDDIEEEFRDEGLTNIMRQRKEERKKLEHFKQLCSRNGQELPVVTVGEEPREPPQLDCRLLDS